MHRGEAKPDSKKVSQQSLFLQQSHHPLCQGFPFNLLLIFFTTTHGKFSSISIQVQDFTINGSKVKKGSFLKSPLQSLKTVTSVSVRSIPLIK